MRYLINKYIFWNKLELSRLTDPQCNFLYRAERHWNKVSLYTPLKQENKIDQT